MDAAYDPADGYVYVTWNYAQAQVAPWLLIVKDPCTLVKKIPLRMEANVYDGQIAFDPLTEQMVAIDDYNGVAYVVKGTSLIDTFGGFGGFPGHLPLADVWDSGLKAMLVADDGDLGGRVDLLYLNQSGQTLNHAIVVDAFDQGNQPENLIVADGLIFVAGDKLDVFNATTLKFLGSFGSQFSTSSGLAWDPMTLMVVVGLHTLGPLPPVPDNDSLAFLNASSVYSGTFTYRFLHTSGILQDGVGDVAYSPASHDIYFDGVWGDDLWYLTPAGKLGNVWLENYADWEQETGVLAIAYDPVDQDVYVCGLSLFVVS
ncbi:MAG: hypothetical protein WB778_06620 [Thermoplasmata archaeon]